MPVPENELDMYVEDYLDDQSSSWDAGVIGTALAAEKAAQQRVCRISEVDSVLIWPDDLAEALCRRVAHNLAVRALPLGVQANITEAAVSTTRVGGTDAEVRRLEAPHIKRVVA